jgi:BASS family bile acid:Na+ symporter
MTDAGIAFVNTVFVPLGLMLIMFSMGLTLSLRDFGAVLREPKLVGAGFATHLFVLPLIGLAVGALFRLPPELALGLFIVSICPAGTTSNALTFVGRGNVALAVVLTALTSLVTVFTIPLLLSWALPHFLGGRGAAVPQMSVPTTILQLVRITVLPMAVGMIVRKFAPLVAEKLAHWLRPTAMVVLVGVIGFAVVVSWRMVLVGLGAALPAVLALNITAMAFGLFLGRAISAAPRDAMTLSIETGVQNVTLAIFLTLSILKDLPLAVALNIYGVVMLVNATLLIRWWRARLA